MDAYSADLRERVLAALAAGEKPGQVARVFRVGRATVYRWLAALRGEGRRVAERMGGTLQPLVHGESLAVLRGIVEGCNDLTLAECRDRLAEKSGIRVSVPTIHRALRRLDWT